MIYGWQSMEEGSCSHPKNSESFVHWAGTAFFLRWVSKRLSSNCKSPSPSPCCVSTTLDLRPPPTSAHCPLGSTFEPPPLRPFVKKRRRRSTRGAEAAAVQCPILAVGREKEGREGGRLDDGAQGALFFAAPTAEYLCIWRREERGKREGGRVIIFKETQKGKELLLLFFHI